MKVVVVFSHGFNVNTWLKVIDILREDGIELRLFNQSQNPQEAIEYIETHEPELFVSNIYHTIPFYEELIAAGEKCANRICSAGDSPHDFSSFSKEDREIFFNYMKDLSSKNYANGIKYILNKMGLDLDFHDPEPVVNDGIYYPGEESFTSSKEYFQWYESKYPHSAGRDVAAILVWYGGIVENNCDEVNCLVGELEKSGFIPLCIHCAGMKSMSLPIEERYAWRRFIMEDIKPFVILNLMAGRLLKDPSDYVVLEEINVPVIHLIKLFSQSPEEWAQEEGGFGPGSQGLVFSLTQPEMSGIIEPTVVAGTEHERDPHTGLNFRKNVPIPERIEFLCRRLKRWAALSGMDNSEKRVTIILNNNPCKGVEATLGVAVGLETFTSLALFLSALGEAGYDIGDAPNDGKEILDMFLSRKALSEFRWTTVEEIDRKGGVLHYTDRDEYEGFMEEIPAEVRDKVVADWGEFPGEGMVLEREEGPAILVTGLKFGNIQIIVQPKRGCYGARCDGEVCRILHDPAISPPPHWLATYRYIKNTSDAIVNFGAHGALEFLPGKRAALSDKCFPEVSLDDLPNVYLYVMDVPADGLVGKRRGRALMVDHLTPVNRPAELDPALDELENLLTQYEKSIDNSDKERRTIIMDNMIPLMEKMGFMDEGGGHEGFLEVVPLLSRSIGKTRRTLMPQGMHVLGTSPGMRGAASMVATVLINPVEERPTLEELASWKEEPSGKTYDDAVDVIVSILQGNDHILEGKGFPDFAPWARDIANKIEMSDREIPQLLRALNGEYIEPGLSGSLTLGKTQTLPTGRNFYTSDVQAMPTPAAMEAGRELANNLLHKYLEEEGQFPESVAINLWSVDAFKSDGEVFCQILHLMGFKPTWQSTGKVSEVVPLPLEELTLQGEDQETMQRPRVDVIIQTSSILRDMVPHFVALIDEAVVAAGELEEPHELNFIKKHTDDNLAQLMKDLEEKMPRDQLRRLAGFRVFSSAPGSFGGNGVGFALDASAWEKSEDLAEIHINGSGYAYGSDGSGNIAIEGMEAHSVYAMNLKKVDVTYMRQYSPEYDLVEAGSYSVAMGGMSTAVSTVKGKKSKLYWSDVNSQGDRSVRDLKSELECSVRARLLNPKWIEHQKSGGYKGAAAVSGSVNNLFKWSATTGEVEARVFDSIAKTYILNKENLEWLRESNPYALEELTRRLMEAHGRGLWETDIDLLEEVQSAALMLEGDMEEEIGEYAGDYQGSRVDILTGKDVEKWNMKWKIKG